MTANQLLNQVFNFGIVAGVAGGLYWLYRKYTQPVPQPQPQPQPQDYTNLASAYNLMSNDLGNVEQDISDIKTQLATFLAVLNRTAINSALAADTANRIEQDLSDGVPIDW